jgi:hypothetical protein
VSVRFLAAIAVLLVATGAQAQPPSEQPWRSSERVTCSIAAGVKFGVPANIVLAIAEIEGGRPGQWVRNRNGSYDVGPLQFNTRYLDHLQRHYGITAADVAAAGCYSYELAAWRLRKHLEFDRGDQWTRIANYHSRSPAENERYRAKVIRAAATWARWLSEHVGGGGGVHEQQVVAVEVQIHPSERAEAPKRAQRRAVDSLAADGAPVGEDADILRELVGDDVGLARRESAPKGGPAYERARKASDANVADEAREHAALLKLLAE